MRHVSSRGGMPSWKFPVQLAYLINFNFHSINNWFVFFQRQKQFEKLCFSRSASCIINVRVLSLLASNFHDWISSSPYRLKLNAFELRIGCIDSPRSSSAAKTRNHFHKLIHSGKISSSPLASVNVNLNF